ncbi:DUF4099 domain-containing protein [Pedobacter sp. Leaf250]|uniref:DUF4099 domain-containing protein n=1 Tax=Pedobacter sp. Leaf250 TaxID=2876559 RepID=UPI001E3E29B9|nr:DUF4099 domain-containing protein [Pedobacter sp. Leaf250]
MMNTLFDIKELPLSQFEDLGLYHDKQLLLGPEEIQALLNGRRTDLISLRALKGEGFEIERLDARLSLRREDSGELSLMIHPIYRTAREHPLLTAGEIDDLINGRKDFVGRRIDKEEGRWAMYNIEYDPETKDFVGYDVAKVQTPERINGMLLNEEEKSAFRRGELIELTDGTRVQHRASDPKGIRSDRKVLVLSVLLDGGISYLLIRGIRSIRDGANQLNHHTTAFNQALAEMQGAKNVIQQGLSPEDSRHLGTKKITRH